MSVAFSSLIIFSVFSLSCLVSCLLRSFSNTLDFNVISSFCFWIKSEYLSSSLLFFLGLFFVLAFVLFVFVFRKILLFFELLFDLGLFLLAFVFVFVFELVFELLK